MAYLFLGALGVVLLLLLLQNLANAEIQVLVRTIKWTLVGVMTLAIIYLTLVGRLFHVAALFCLLLLLLKRDIQNWFKKKEPPLSLHKPMSLKEAATLLGIDIKATPQEIKKAFNQQTPKDSTHHDRLCQARDLLLKHKKKP